TSYPYCVIGLLFPPFVSPFYTPSTTHISTLSLHDALPISFRHLSQVGFASGTPHPGLLWEICPNDNPSPFHRLRQLSGVSTILRSEEHTSELQSRFDLVCRLLLEKKNITKNNTTRFNNRK